MARRAQQGAVARCPWCESSIPQVAAECPECRFPLTMAAAEGGFVSERAGTTSTATPAGWPPRPVPGFHSPSALASAHASRAHRLRLGAWLLGMLSVLLLLAGVGAAVSTSSPDARSDREAITSLLTALHRATDDPGHRQEIPITTLRGAEPSVQPSRVSTDQASSFWFGTARSTSGQCFMVAGRLSDGVALARGTLSKNEPCTAAQLRSHLEQKLIDSNGS